MMFKVTTQPKAESDVLLVFEYLYSRSPSGADAWMKAYVNALGKLQQNADGYPVAEENDHFDIELKQSLFKTRRGIPYRLIFNIEGNQVRILRVRGPGQANVTPDEITLKD